MDRLTATNATTVPIQIGKGLFFILTNEELTSILYKFAEGFSLNSLKSGCLKHIGQSEKSIG